MGLGELLHRVAGRHGGAAAAHPGAGSTPEAAADHEHGDGVIHAPRLYDAMCHVGFLGRRATAYRRVARIAGVRPGDRVLDIGCGTGALTRALAELAGPSGAVVGIDPGEEMIRRARELGPRRIDYREMRAESLELPDGSCDVVATMLALHHVGDELQERALAEARRVLRPGGTLLVVEFRPPVGGLGARAATALLGDTMARIDPAGLVDTVAGAGFEGVTRSDPAALLVAIRGRRPATRHP